MALIQKTYLVCDFCKKEELLNEYKRYTYVSNASLNNPPGANCIRDGMMLDVLYLCGSCGDRIRSYIKGD